LSRGVALFIFFLAVVFGVGFWAQEHYLKTAVAAPPAASAVAPEAIPTSIDPKVVAAIQDRVAKSGADVGIAFETLDGRLAWS
jgi:hypothetical protein